MSIVGPFVKVVTQRESRHVGRQLGFANDASCIIHINIKVAWVYTSKLVCPYWQLRVLTIHQLAKHCLGYRWDLDSSSAHEGSASCAHAAKIGQYWISCWQEET